MSTVNLRGVGVALVTPFTEQKEVNYAEFEKVCHYVLENGVDYLVVLGTTGETASLTHKEKQALIDETKHSVLKAAHPSPFSADKGFFGCKHFSKTNELLMKQHKEPINWKL